MFWSKFDNEIELYIKAKNIGPEHIMNVSTLDIKYTLQQIIRKEGKHKSTLICISNKDGINKMFEYIYE